MREHLRRHPQGRRRDRRRRGPGATRGECCPLVGGAAKGIASRIERHGYELVAGPEGFLIEGDAGLLRPGERDRARSWGADQVRRAMAVTEPWHLPPDPVGRR